MRYIDMDGYRRHDTQVYPLVGKQKTQMGYKPKERCSCKDVDEQTVAGLGSVPSPPTHTWMRRAGSHQPQHVFCEVAQRVPIRHAE